MKSPTTYWLIYGVVAFSLFTKPSSNPIPPPLPPKGKKPPTTPIKPKKDNDVISYYLDSGTGLFIVKTNESPDVQWGAPELKSEKLPAFQAMVSRWKQLVDDAGVNSRVPSRDIFAIMWSESQGNPNVTSPAGAKGLMQVMPFHFPPGSTDATMLDPKTNIQTGVGIMASRRASGSRDLVQVASLYNAGGNSDGTPFSNDQRPKLATRWGYASEPGYIDSVIAAYNTAVKVGVMS